MYKFNLRQYFLLLMDMSMPVLDSFESTVKFREFERKQEVTGDGHLRSDRCHK